jgi:hypothetical protein
MENDYPMRTLRFLCAAATMLAIAAAARGEDLPSKPGVPVVLASKLAGDVLWVVLDGEQDLIAIDRKYLKDAGVFVAVPQKPGLVRVQAIGIDDGKPAFELFRVRVEGPPAPVPVPVPVPPTPTPTPPAPEPSSELTTKLKAALVQDVAEKNGDLMSAALLGKIFTDSAALLEQIGDPTIVPKTATDYFNKLAVASLLSGIPRPPYLSKTRSVIGAHLAGVSPDAPLLDALKADLVTKSRQVGKALAEAAK